MHILLQGVVGSNAYGLAGPDSDVDHLGVYAAPTADLLGLATVPESIVTSGPDITMHEARKALRLMLGCNPTASEILWLDSYEVLTGLGKDLVLIRDAFLSAERVKNAYLGYATQQFRKLLTRGDGSFDSDIPPRRAPKHARHLMRLVEQGFELYTTGQLTVRLQNPDEVMDFGFQAAKDPAVAQAYVEKAEARFASATTVLPTAPDITRVETWLQLVRRHYYSQEP